VSPRLRFRRLSALATLLLASTSLVTLNMAGRAEELNLPPIEMPTTKAQCLVMLDTLIMDMATYMSGDEFAQLYQNMPFDLAIKRDCEAENFGAAYQQVMGLRPTSKPDFQQSTSQPSNCFLTTACCELVGLEDNCFELSVLRRYRDEVLPILPGGKAEIALYYALAPAVLAKLRGRRAERDLLRLYWTHILPCVAMAWLGFRQPTRKRYRDLLARVCVAAGVRPAAA
jgi:hypothetical protein